MIPDFQNFLNEKWLMKGHGIAPKPTLTDPDWRKVNDSNCTKQTIAMLNRLSEYCSDVAIYSWHPNIETAQYSDDPENFNSSYYRDDASNQNSRSLIESSIIVKWKPNYPKRTFDDRVEKAIKEVPGIEVLGGNGGGNDKTGAEFQHQVSFLRYSEKQTYPGKGTHQDVERIKYETLTPGAYTQKKDGWYMVPEDDFDPHPEFNRKRLELAEKLRNIILMSPYVQDVTIRNTPWNEGEPVLQISFNEPHRVTYDNPQYREYSRDCKTIDLKLKGGTNFKYSLEDRFDMTKLERILNVLNLFDPVTDKRLSDNLDDYMQILHKYRGNLLGKELNIA